MKFVSYLDYKQKIDLVERNRKIKDTLKHACCGKIEFKTTKYVLKILRKFVGRGT